ncbi:MAG: mechanosensitive ion channel family protein [Granulosicoccus sp.]|nr:mechanosensitive ion channel family protein [Granulosicoccus sp.]
MDVIRMCGQLAAGVRVLWVVLLLAGAASIGSAQTLEELIPSEQQSDESVESVRPIKATSSGLDDLQIANRLREIYAEIDALAEVSVTVNNSVVNLAGAVDTASARSRAIELAAQVDGVVEVVEGVEVSTDVGDRVGNAWDRLSVGTTGLLALLPLLLIATGILVGFWFLARYVSAKSHWFSHVAPNQFIAELLALVVRMLIVLTGVVLALMLLDATSVLTTVLGAAGIVGLAIGFAVRDTVENFIASLLLSLRNPFSVNDYVDVDGNQGTVSRLTSRATILISPDGNQIRIPNAMVYKAIITNYTAQPNRRFLVRIPIDEVADVASARTLISECLVGTQGVLSEPAPLVIIEALEESVIWLQAYGWVDQRAHHFQKVQSAFMMRIKAMLRSHGIVMPESARTVRLTSESSTALLMDREKGKPVMDDQRDRQDEKRKSVDTKDADDVDTTPDTALKVQVQQEQAGNENLLNEASPNE